MQTSNKIGTDPIYDARTLGTPRMLVLGVQHMFAMFGATVLVPALTGLNVATTLLLAGLGTLLFHLITKGKVPAFLGSSFAFLGGYWAIAPNGEAELLPYACVGVACAGLLYILLAILAVLVLILYLLRRKLRHTAAYQKIAEFLSGIFAGIKSITRLPHKWMFIVYTVLIWLMYYLMIFFMSYAFRETTALSAANILYLMTVGGLAQLVPVQGGIGAYHSAMKIGIPILGIAAITPNLAMAFATLNHATQTLMQIFTGAIALAMISRAKVRRMSHSERSAAEKD